MKSAYQNKNVTSTFDSTPGTGFFDLLADVILALVWICTLYLGVIAIL